MKRQSIKQKAGVGFYFSIFVLLFILMALAWRGNWANAGSTTMPAAVETPTTAPSTRVVVPDDLRQKLIGQWLRLDGGYILTIQSIEADGKVVAIYNNPRPINVSKSQITNEGGRNILFVELRDRGYPGSYYTLSYDSEQDQLKGFYHHLGIGQTFDIYFERLRKEATGKN